MEITLEKLRQIIKVVRESPIDGSMAGTGAGTHHAQSGIRMYRGRGGERERRRKDGQDDQIDEIDAYTGADMYTLAAKAGEEPERVSRGHAKSVRSVEDPGHPVNIAEDDDF
tara:strand:- start:1341 stop:1676 length:336 start_codon:yes stop_codon:yes gene_type:complete